MVTLKACIIMKDMRKDGTWRVVIRLTYKRKSRMIPTSMYVSREDITASGNIKNQQVIDECERIIAGDIRCLFDRPEAEAKTFYGIFRTRSLRPKVLVDYTREPYVFPAEDVRITFDKNVRTGMRSTDLFDPDVPTFPVWDLKGCMILEVKFNASLPEFCRSIVQMAASQHTAASKYVYCRQFDF